MTQPSYTAFRIRLCTEAERALEHALDKAGCQVTGEEVLAAWSHANAGAAPPDTRKKQWSYILGPAFATGRVLRIGQHLLGVPGHPASLVAPPPAPCSYGDETLKRCALAERVVRQLVQERGEMVSAGDVNAEWSRIIGSPAPPVVAKSIPRVLEPALHAGRVRVIQKLRSNYFAPAACADAQPPQFSSNLERTEEALRRAVEKAYSAVPLPLIQEEVDADSSLALKATKLRLCHFVRSLVETDRSQIVRHVDRYEDTSRYYSVPGGPTWVRSSVEMPLDRRWRSIIALWRASGGRPFTTSALKAYADSRPGLRLHGSPAYAWTNALHHFLGQKALIRIHREERWQVLWAPAQEWTTLSEEEQQQRLSDDYRLTDEPSSGYPLLANGLSPDSPVYDTGFVSRNQNMRVLVRYAKAIRAAAEPDETRRQLLASRPVTLSDVSQAAVRRPVLVQAGVPLRTQLSEAARLRPEMRRTAVVQVGRVANRAFYDTLTTESGTAYVDFRAALRAASRHRLARVFAELLRAAELARSGILPLAETILQARAAGLSAELHQRRAALEQAFAAADLLTEETTAAKRILAQLGTLQEEVQRWIAAEDMACGRERRNEENRETTVDSADAFRAIESVVDFKLVTPRQLAWRSPLITHMRIVAEGSRQDFRSSSGYGRPVELRIDRVTFVAYSAARWAGTRAATHASAALHALGALRTPAPFTAALEDHEKPSAHPAAAAALGLLDDEESRAVLTNYLKRNIVSPGRHGHGTSVPAAEFAAYGLAPTPFAPVTVTLREPERIVLELVAVQGADEHLRLTARRVLRAWAENWTTEQLMEL